MKERIHGLLVVALIALGIIWFTPLGNYATTKVQKERVEILERAKTSSDPEILKQAELVRRDISREYNNSMANPNQNMSDSELSKFWAKIRPFTLKSIIVISVIAVSSIFIKNMLKNTKIR